MLLLLADRTQRTSEGSRGRQAAVGQVRDPTLYHFVSEANSNCCTMEYSQNAERSPEGSACEWAPGTDCCGVFRFDGAHTRSGPWRRLLGMPAWPLVEAAVVRSTVAQQIQRSVKGPCDVMRSCEERVVSGVMHRKHKSLNGNGS